MRQNCFVLLFFLQQGKLYNNDHTWHERPQRLRHREPILEKAASLLSAAPLLQYISVKYRFLALCVCTDIYQLMDAWGGMLAWECYRRSGTA